MSLRNNWSGIGRLVKDPESFNMNNGGSIASFTLACDSSYKNKEGEWVNKADFVPFKSFNQNLNKLIDKALQKGYEIAVSGGKFKTESYDDREGNKRYSTYIELGFNSTIDLISKPKSEGDQQRTQESRSSQQASQQSSQQASQQSSQQTSMTDDLDGLDDDDDDLPF